MYYENKYIHCGSSWVETADSACNDRCPICNKEIEPTSSNYIISEGQHVWELTLYGFDGSTDETDYRVLWIMSDKEHIELLINKTDFINESWPISIDDYRGVDFILPLDFDKALEHINTIKNKDKV